MLESKEIKISVAFAHEVKDSPCLVLVELKKETLHFIVQHWILLKVEITSTELFTSPM